MTYYIIEHPTRGTLRPDSEVGEPHFSWSGHRTDEKTAWRFESLKQAIRVLNSHITDVKTRNACQVRRSPSPDEERRWREDAWVAVYRAEA
jgi:hypothetical protein